MYKFHGTIYFSFMDKYLPCFHFFSSLTMEKNQIIL